MRRVWSALFLVLVIFGATATTQWNKARLSPAPEPRGERLVDVRKTAWGELYLPVGHDTLPTVVFSPGLGVEVSAYRVFLTDIASHGFLIVAVPYPSTVRVEDNADFVPALPRIADALGATLDRIAWGGDSLLSRADARRVAVVGHSFGGAAAATACADPRFRAAVDLDGSLYGRVVHEGVRCPFLLIEQSLSRADTIDKPVFYEERSQGRLHEDSVIAHSKSVTWKTLEGLDHMSFTDPGLAFLTSHWIKESAGLRLNAAMAQRITADLTLAFLAEHLTAHGPDAAPRHAR